VTTQKKGLGKGLQALITENQDSNSNDILAGVLEIDINRVEPNKDQPRKYFEDDALQELADSISQFGIIQPLLVKKEDGFYSIIAGERRWRAARLAKLEKVPVIVKEYNAIEVLQVALIENIQRSDLNPIEEALAYKRLLEEHSLTQEGIAERVGKSRSNIANMLRLLKLDARVQAFLADNKLSIGHVRPLLILDEAMQIELAEKIMEEELSVREVESLVQRLSEPVIESNESVKKEKQQKDVHYENAEKKLNSLLGTKVNIRGKNKGKIEIEYFSPEELDRLLCLLQKVEN